MIPLPIPPMPGTGNPMAEESTADARVADTIYSHLRDEILDRRLSAGERLSVPAIAERFQVSRSPVREAVLRLVQNDFAQEIRNRGATVTHVRVEDLGPLYEVREVLEGLAAGLSAVHATREQLGALQRNLTRHEAAVAAGDLTAHIALDLQFHALITEAAGNPVLLAHLEKIHQKIRLGMLEAGQAGAEVALREHRGILQAILAGDRELAESLAKAHVHRVRSDLFG